MKDDRVEVQLFIAKAAMHLLHRIDAVKHHLMIWAAGFRQKQPQQILAETGQHIHTANTLADAIDKGIHQLHAGPAGVGTHLAGKGQFDADEGEGFAGIPAAKIQQPVDHIGKEMRGDQIRFVELAYGIMHHPGFECGNPGGGQLIAVNLTHQKPVNRGPIAAAQAMRLRFGLGEAIAAASADKGALHPIVVGFDLMKQGMALAAAQIVAAGCQ